MSEFSEVMRQYRRFCKSHSTCGECQFDGKDICDEMHLSDVPFEEIEREIMRWAADHPVIYPTWAEYLSSNGFLRYVPETETYYDFTRLFQPIPDDIAERLGIKPKEDV